MIGTDFIRSFCVNHLPAILCFAPAVTRGVTRGVALRILAIAALLPLSSYAASEEGDRAIKVLPASKPTQTSSEGGSKWALLVGINDYEDEEIRDLRYAVNDARELHDLLTDPECGEFDKDNVILITNEASEKQYLPTKVNIMLALDTIARKAEQEDTVIISYSGHGFEEKDEERGERYRKRYLLPIETDLRSIEAYAIDNEDFVEKIKKIEAKRVIVFLDSCHAGGISRLGKEALGRPLSPDYYRVFEDARGVITFSSCKGDQESFESEEHRHGIFTKYLLDALRGAADSNRDGVATFEEIQKYVHPRVKEWSIRFKGPKRLQEPVVHAADVTNFDVMIARCTVPGVLTLDVKPSHGEYSARIDGVNISTPVANYNLNPGLHRVDIRARGYEGFQKTIEVRSNQEHYLEIGLSPRSRLKAALKSTIIPGWGDLPDRRNRGVLTGLLQVGTLIGLGLAHLDYAEKSDEYETALEMDSVENEAFSTFQEYEAHHSITLAKYDKMLDSRRIRNALLLSATMGIRILAASEAAIFMPRAVREGSRWGKSPIPLEDLSSIEDGSVILVWRHSF